MNPTLKTDFYKQGHKPQYPEGTTLVCSNLTARGTRMKGIDGVVHFGTQASIQMLQDDFQLNFFSRPIEDVVASFKRRLDTALGINADTSHIEALHKLGYLPLEFWALPEGEVIPLRVPMVQFWNTRPEFFWLTNFIETEFSCNTWPFITSATTALQYKKILQANQEETDPEAEGFADFQGHDFSYRGMFGSQAAAMSGLAHLTSFKGTDTIPAIEYAETYYDANAEEELVGTSVWATEHSVMCMGGKEDETQTFQRLIEDVYPSGIVSIVSDTWNLWNVVGGDDSICSKLKDKILSREGKVVIRPDSGCPVRITCGYTAADKAQMPRSEWDKLSEFEIKGVVECLWDIFGGTESKTGFKKLDEHIGAIYGDSITIERAEEICQRLKDKGFATTNVVLGIGSFTYQGAVSLDCIVTRDTHGMAIKATYGEVKGEPREIFKDPITDDGLKKSAKGLIAVVKEDGVYKAIDQRCWEAVRSGEMKRIWKNGKFIQRTSLEDIRCKLTTE